jgi:hypothetical protein
VLEPSDLEFMEIQGFVHFPFYLKKDSKIFQLGIFETRYEQNPPHIFQGIYLGYSIPLKIENFDCLWSYPALPD